eukprot:IDg5975t1
MTRRKRPRRVVVQEGSIIELYRWEEEHYDRAIVLEASCPMDECHKLQYDDGFRERVDLSSETWRYVGFPGSTKRCISKRPEQDVDKNLFVKNEYQNTTY